jgi:hypothetical protein
MAGGADSSGVIEVPDDLTAPNGAGGTDIPEAAASQEEA